MAEIPPDKRIFVIRDFSITGVEMTLQLLQRRHPNIIVPGVRGSRSQGQVFRDIVHDGVKQADAVLALVDLPNVNMGFELGYSLGLGKQLALACARAELPSWLNEPPLNGFLVSLGIEIRELEVLVTSAQWISPLSRPESGEQMLFCCPTGGDGEALHAVAAESKMNLRTLPARGWSLYDLPEKLSGVESVVWTLVPSPLGADVRDGHENTAASVVAGYALGSGIRLYVLRHPGFRHAVDVVDREDVFHDIEEFEKKLRRFQLQNQPLARIYTASPMSIAWSDSEPAETSRIVPIFSEQWPAVIRDLRDAADPDDFRQKAYIPLREELSHLILSWRPTRLTRQEIAELMLSLVTPELMIAEMAFIYFSLERLGCSPEHTQFFGACSLLPSAGISEPEFVPICGGIGVMGARSSEVSSFPSDELPQHQVRVSSFEIAATTVTTSQYQAFDKNHSAKHPPVDKVNCLPVTEVNWWEAYLFCKWIGARLPTEAEWEYACRSGTQTSFHTGECITKKQASCTTSSSSPDLVPVKTFDPNKFGLYEMHGNVGEWCLDGLREYTNDPQLDPVGPLGYYVERAVRGGGYNYHAEECRSASRRSAELCFQVENIGFRPAK